MTQSSLPSTAAEPVLVSVVLAYRLRSAALALIAAAGTALMIWIPLELLPKHHEETASWWRQLLGMSYVWWALAAIVVVGLTTASQAASPRRSPGSAPVADLLRPA